MIMKLGILVILLFLTGCSRMTGPTLTSCEGIQAGLVSYGVGETVIIIEGYDEEILTWTVSTTLTRVEFDAEFLHGIYLSDEEIYDLFVRYNPLTITGVVVSVETSENHITIHHIYHYHGISDEDLNQLWGVDDFTNDITLSSAIEGLEEQGAVCNPIETIANDE